MNIILFSSSPPITNLVKNILSNYNVVSSTNPVGFVNSDYDMVIIEDNLFVKSIFDLNVPVLLITVASNLVGCSEVRQLGGDCINKPFTRDMLLNVVKLMTE